VAFLEEKALENTEVVLVEEDIEHIEVDQEQVEVVEHTEVVRIGVGVVLVKEGHIVPVWFVERIVVGAVQVKEGHIETVHLEDIELLFVAVLASCELLVVVEEEALHKLQHLGLELLQVFDGLYYA